MFDKDTTELFHELQKGSDVFDVESFLLRNEDEFKLPLHKYLSGLLVQKGLSKFQVINKLAFDPTHAYHIFAGKKNPSRDSLFSIARAMNMNLEETQYLLRYGGFGALYPRNLGMRLLSLRSRGICQSSKPIISSIL